jgi:hypothetical protein
MAATTMRQTDMPTGSKQSADAQRKIQELRELFADAPEVGKTALRNVLQRLTSDASKTPPPPVESAGRAGNHDPGRIRFDGCTVEQLPGLLAPVIDPEKAQ